MRVCVGNVKGGTGKTSTAVHLALGLCRSGRTLLVDADPGQDGAMDWADLAEDWPAEQCTVVKAASRDLVKQVRPMLADYRHVVFDVGPKNPLMLRQAMSLCEHLIVPSAPTSHDLADLRPTFDIAAEVDAVQPLTAAVLLLKVRPGTRNEREARAMFAGEDIPVMDNRVRLLQRFEYARGTAPAELGDYEAVLQELAVSVG